MTMSMGMKYEIWAVDQVATEVMKYKYALLSTLFLKCKSLY